MGVLAKFQLYRRLKKARKKLKEEMMLQGIPRALKVFVVVAAPPAVAYISAACPALFTYAGVVALVGAVVAAVFAGNKSKKGVEATAQGAGAFGVFTIGYLAAKDWIDATCGTAFLQQLPTLATTALSIGIAAYMKGTKEA